MPDAGIVILKFVFDKFQCDVSCFARSDARLRRVMYRLRRSDVSCYARSCGINCRRQLMDFKFRLRRRGVRGHTLKGAAVLSDCCLRRRGVREVAPYNRKLKRFDKTAHKHRYKRGLGRSPKQRSLV